MTWLAAVFVIPAVTANQAATVPAHLASLGLILAVLTFHSSNLLE